MQDIMDIPKNLTRKPSFEAVWEEAVEAVSNMDNLYWGREDAKFILRTRAVEQANRNLSGS